MQAEVQYNLTSKGFWLKCKDLKSQKLEGPLADIGARLRHAENNGKVEANCWTTDE
jgi:hypothetical protein